MKLLGFLDPKAIVTDLDDCSKDEVIRRLVDAAVATSGIPVENTENIVEQVLAREAKGSTGLGGGVALPHVKGTDDVHQLCGAFGRSDTGIDYNAVDGRPVHVLFLILSPKDQLDQHIGILRRISEIRENEHYLASFQRAKSGEALAKLIGGLGGAS
jgi:mannitol/fructose-specific phosphotransferase system IIA component (Ntr-type)